LHYSGRACCAHAFHTRKIHSDRFRFEVECYNRSIFGRSLDSGAWLAQADWELFSVLRMALTIIARGRWPFFVRTVNRGLLLLARALVARRFKGSIQWENDREFVSRHHASYGAAIPMYDDYWFSSDCF